MTLVSELDLPAFDYAQPGGVEGIYGIDKLPIIWSGSSAIGPSHSTMSPSYGPGPDVT